MYKSYSWNFEDQKTIVLEPEICPPEQSSSIPLLPSPPIPYQLQSNDPFQQMRDANRDFRIYKEYLQNRQQIARTQDLNTTYAHMVSLPPQTLEPPFEEHTAYLKENPVYAVAEHLASMTGLQITGCALAILAGVAASLQGRVIVRNNGKWLEPLILRSLQCAPSGHHKSQVCAPLLESFFDFERHSFSAERLTRDEAQIADALLRKKRAAFVKDTDIFADGALDALKEFAAQMNDSPITKALEQTRHPVQVVTTESTAYAVQNLMASNGGAMFFASPEGTGIEKLFDKRKLETFNKSFCQEHITYSYGKRQITISYPSLSMLVFLQDGVVAKLYTGKGSVLLHESGVLARFLVFLHQPSIKMPTSETSNHGEDSLSLYKKRIWENLKSFYTKDQGAKKFIIYLDWEAQNMLQEFDNQLSSRLEQLSEQKAWLARLAGQTARLAGALHFFRHGLEGLKMKICKDDYLGALDIANTLIHHNHWLVSPTGLAAKENAKKILAYINRIPNQTTKQNIISTGLSSSKIASLTGLRKLEVNNALYLLFYANQAAIFDDCSGNLQARFRPELYGINLQISSMLPQSFPISLF